MLLTGLENPIELANRWRVPLSWVYSKTRKSGPDAIPRIRLGKYLRFKPEEVDLWLMRCNKERN
jgi:hypothetical protein